MSENEDRFDQAIRDVMRRVGGLPDPFAPGVETRLPDGYSHWDVLLDEAWTELGDSGWATAQPPCCLRPEDV